jgi:hypothetical protein
MDAGEVPHAEKMSERFAGRRVYSLVDFFSFYDQITIAMESRDLTGMNTPLGFIRLTCLPQGWTNSVAYAQRAATKVLGDLIPDPCEVFIDDIGIKGSRDVDNSYVEDGVRKFIWEHIQVLDEVFSRIGAAGLTVSGEKLVLCVEEIVIMSYRCNKTGRQMEKSKIQKILEWPRPSSLGELRSFVGLCKHYRVLIKDFSSLCEPLNRLTRKDEEFVWGEEQEAAFQSLKRVVSSDPVIAEPDFYDLEKRPLIIVSDASGVAIGGVLEQEKEDGKRHPIRFESRTFNKKERDYSMVKKECLAVVYNLKVFRPYIFGAKFILEIDAKVVVHWINSINVPDPTVARWIAFIRSHDMEVRHVPSEKNHADALSRMPNETQDLDVDGSDMDDTVDAVLMLKVDEEEVEEPGCRVFVMEGKLDGEFKKIADYLSTLQKPEDMSEEEFKKIKMKSQNYVVQFGFLFLKPGRILDIPRRVICLEEEKKRILAECHEGVIGGHRGRDATIKKISQRYYWPGITEDVDQFVKTCSRCQYANKTREFEPLVPMWSSAVLMKVHVDVVHMPKGKGGFVCYVNARDDLTGFVDGKPLRNHTSAGIARFLLEYMSRYGMVGRFVSDNGELRKDDLVQRLKDCGVEVTFTSSYHPQANGVVERGQHILSFDFNSPRKSFLWRRECRNSEENTNSGVWAR